LLRAAVETAVQRGRRSIRRRDVFDQLSGSRQDRVGPGAPVVRVDHALDWDAIHVLRNLKRTKQRADQDAFARGELFQH
jgi:hypothetical protein